MNLVRYRGSSMTPLFRPLDRLHVQAVPLPEIVAGDVVVFAPVVGEELIVHRVITTGSGVLITQGDNMEHPDTVAVTAERLRGQVVSLERDGRHLTVDGGGAGLAVFRAQQGRRHRRGQLRRIWLGVLGPCRRVLADGPVGRALARRLTRVTIQREAGPEHRLCLAGHVMAVRRAGESRWRTRAILAPLLDPERAWSSGAPHE